MSKKVFFGYFLVCFSILLASTGYAKEQSKAGAFLTFGAGARAAGMGGAFVALAEDATASYWNPAGLAFLDKRIEIMAQHTLLTLDRSYNFLSLARAVNKKTALALSWIRFGVEDIPKYDENNNYLGTFSDSENALTLSYSRRLTYKIGVGANLKYIFHNLESHSASGWGIDLGIRWKASPKFSYGLMAENIGEIPLEWDTGHKDVIPFNFRTGLAYQFNHQLIFALDYDKRTNLHLGIELPIKELFTLRLGSDNGSLTIGAGFKQRKGMSLTLDYAYERDELGDIHRFSLMGQF